MRWVVYVWHREVFADPRAATAKGARRTVKAVTVPIALVAPVHIALALRWYLTGAGPYGGYLRRTSVKPKPWPVMRRAAKARARVARGRG